MVEIEMADDISWEYAKIAPSAPPPIPILNNELLARQLRQAREDAGLSIARLSELLGISQGTVSNIEHGGKVRHSTEQKVRKWLNEPQNLNA